MGSYTQLFLQSQRTFPVMRGIEGYSQGLQGYALEWQILSLGCFHGNGCSWYLWLYVFSFTVYVPSFLVGIYGPWRARQEGGVKEKEWQESHEYHGIFNALLCKYYILSFYLNSFYDLWRSSHLGNCAVNCQKYTQYIQTCLQDVIWCTGGE